MRIKHEMIINCSPERVFYWLSDPNRAMKWQTGVADFEILNEEPGMVGTTFREWIEEDGKRVEMCGKVTEFVENEKISMSLSGKFNSVDVKFVLKKIESGTCLTQIANLRFNSSYKLMTIIMRPVIKKKITLQFRRDFLQLKELCETT